MKSKGKSSLRKKLLTALVSLLAVMFVVLLAATVYVEWVLGRFYYDPDAYGTLSQEEIDALLQDDQGNTAPPDATVIEGDDVQWGEVNKIEAGEHILNILLVGQDRRPGEQRARTDAMLLVTVNTKTKTVTTTSFMRDMYVQIPGYYSNRINVAYYLGGAQLLFDTLELNFGIRPDKFVEVDFGGFIDVVELVGGIEMELTKAEADHLNYNEDFYDFPEESWNLKEGKNLLTGKQALAYSRIRMIDPTADFARTERQRKVIAALIDKASDLNLAELNSLLLEMADVITTDMTSREILSYANTLYPMLDAFGEMNSVQIPYGDKFYSVAVEGVGMVLVPDLPGNSAVIAEFQK